MKTLIIGLTLFASIVSTTTVFATQSDVIKTVAHEATQEECEVVLFLVKSKAAFAYCLLIRME